MTWFCFSASSSCSTFVLPALNCASSPLHMEKSLIQALVSASFFCQHISKLIRSALFGMFLLIHSNPANSVNVWKGATISRNMVGGRSQEACQNTKWRCVWCKSCRQLWIRQGGPLTLISSCHRCWHPADSACQCSAAVQTLNVTLSRLELRTHLNLDTDQECIKYLTVWREDRSCDQNSDPRSVLLFLEASRIQPWRLV